MDLNGSPCTINFPGSFPAQMGIFEATFTLVKADSARESTHDRNYTEQAVELLTEQIERRTAWDHEKLLFAAQNDQPMFYNLIQGKIPIELGSQNQHQFIEGEAIQKQNWASQIKTPDLMPDSQLSSLGNFMLEKQKKGTGKGKKVHCNCRKSKCLKMYCECFRNGEICDGCQCCDCGNHDEANEERSRARYKIEEKEPAAFLDISRYKGCRCTRSNCQKGYCECFSAGLMCGKYCECRDCNNCSNYRKNKQKRQHQKSKARRGA